ncbi:MAG: TolC family protein [Sulfurimonas sp.]|jgi:outer membrane protein
MKNKYLLCLFLAGLSFGTAEAEVLNFSRAYELALENANGVRSAVYVSEADKEKINQEDAQLYPQINVSASYKKSEYVSNPSNNTTRQGLISYSFMARQAVYNPDVYTRVDLQESRSKYSQTRAELEKEKLAQDLFNVYIDVLKSKNKINLLESYLEYNKSKLEELTKRYELNLSNKMDLLQMRVEYASAQIELDKENKLFNVYNLKFKQYIGETAYELPKMESNKQISDTIEQMKQRVVSDERLQESLKIRQAQAAVEVSKADVQNAKAGHLPKVTFDMSYTKYGTDTPTVDAAYNSISYAMLSLNLPIYSGGYVSSKVDSAKLMYMASNEDLEKVKKETQVAYDEYLAIFEASAQSVSMYNDAFQSAELYVKAIEQGYEHGLKSIIDLNDAKNKLYEVKYKYIENIYEMVNSYIGLLMVTDNFKDIGLLDKLVE